MCTWSARRCPSSILLSFCAASLRNTSPRWGRSSAYSVFLRHLGMNTTWYLHSHFVWLKLSYSSIDETSFRVLGGSRCEASSVDPRKCQTFAAPRQSRGNSHFGLAERQVKPGHDDRTDQFRDLD